VKAGINKALYGPGRSEETVDQTTIEGPRRKAKMDREARIAAVQEGREGRGKFGSHKGKIDRPHSTTNKQKAREKNFLMMRRKQGIQGKGKRSLRDKQKLLRKHIETGKKQR